MQSQHKQISKAGLSRLCPRKGYGCRAVLLAKFLGLHPCHFLVIWMKEYFNDRESNHIQ